MQQHLREIELGRQAAIAAILALAERDTIARKRLFNCA
jgi:hypothetical protein